jgi:hypothetical protein
MDDLDLMMSDRQLALTLPPEKTQGVQPKAKKKAVKKPAVKKPAVKKHKLKGQGAPTCSLSRGLPVARTGCCKALTVGSDCAGLCSEGLALELLGIPHKHIFAAESNPQVRKLIRNLHGDSIQYFDDVVTRDNAAAPKVHLYVFGAPCQPWSPAGHGKGLQDDRGKVLIHCLRYIKDKLPTLVLMENSHLLASTKCPRDSIKLKRKVVAPPESRRLFSA